MISCPEGWGSSAGVGEDLGPSLDHPVLKVDTLFSLEIVRFWCVEPPDNGGLSYSDSGFLPGGVGVQCGLTG